MIVLPVISDPEPGVTRAERRAQQEWGLADVALLSSTRSLKEVLAEETEPAGLQERYAPRLDEMQRKAADRISDPSLRAHWLAEQQPRVNEQIAAINQRADDLEYERVVREVTAPLTLVEQARWMTDEDGGIGLSGAASAFGVPVKQATGLLNQTNVGPEGVPRGLVEGPKEPRAQSALVPVSQADKEATETILFAAMSDEERKRLLGRKPDLVGGGSGGGYSSGQPVRAPKAGDIAPAQQGPLNILAPGGVPIGQPGSRGIRNLPGEASAAEDLFKRLTHGGTKVPHPNYEGTLFRVPGGGIIGFRPSSNSGGPAIDLNIPGLKIRRLHFPKGRDR